MDLSLIVVLGYEGQSVLVPQPKVTSVDTRPSALPSAEASVSTLKTAGTFAPLPNQGQPKQRNVLNLSEPPAVRYDNFVN